MTTDGRDQEVFLVPVGDETVLAVPISDGRPEDRIAGLPALIQAVGPLVGAVLKGKGVEGASYYELSPESLKMLEDARLDKVGSYFRGVLRNQDGQISHQVQLREVRPSAAPPGLDPVAVAQMAQMAAIQAQLGRIEDTLNDLTMSVEDVMRFLEVQQRARVEAALQILRELHDRARETGEISATDWHRLTGVELDLETQLRAVRQELSQRLSGRSFGVSPSADAKQMKAVEPQRVAELVQLHRLLLGGLRGWNELLILQKFRQNELSEGEAATVMRRLEDLENQHQELLAQLKAVAKDSKQARPRNGLQRLFSDGLILGGSNDERHLKVVADGRRRLEAVKKSAHPEFGGRPPLKVLGAAGTDASDHGTSDGAAEAV